MKKIFSRFTVAFILVACSSNEKVEPKVNMKKDTVTATIPKATDFKSIALDYKKDPVCGMPITAGIEDTLLYKGKIIGFCATECKASFVANPSEYKLTAK
jgi:hypothetical protein